MGARFRRADPMGGDRHALRWADRERATDTATAAASADRRRRARRRGAAAGAVELAGDWPLRRLHLAAGGVATAGRSAGLVGASLAAAASACAGFHHVHDCLRLAAVGLAGCTAPASRACDLPGYRHLRHGPRRPVW